MNSDGLKPKYRAITISGKYVTGTTTLAKNLKKLSDGTY